MTEEERLEKMLLLSYIMGELRRDEEDLKKIPSFTDRELCYNICDLGMLVDWD